VFGLGPIREEAAGLPAQVALSGREQTRRVAWCPGQFPRGVRCVVSERCPNAFGKQPTADGSTATSVCLCVEHDADQASKSRDGSLTGRATRLQASPGGLGP
jgi:hypothetical protein